MFILNRKNLNPIILFELLTLTLLIFLYLLQQYTTNLEFLIKIVELFGAFVVTFLGVYISFTYTLKNDRDKEKKQREKIYIGGLELLSSELSLNEQSLVILVDAIDSVLNMQPGQYYECFGFIMEMARDIKTDVFYNLISSGSINEIIQNDDIFNKVQQAYYNLQKTINGINLSRNVFENYSKTKADSIPEPLRENGKVLILAESKKAKQALTMIQKARKVIENELTLFGVTFMNEPVI